MVQECDNQGTVDLVNNWSSSGRTRHIDVRYKFLRELKEQGLIRVIWTPSHLNEADVFTKNLDRKSFEKCIKNFVGEDEYMIKAGDSEGEGVGSDG
jgi:GH35 family endo-1,4-beta-xylanase